MSGETIPMMKITVFGKFQVESDTHSATNVTGQPEQLLAFLLLQEGHRANQEVVYQTFFRGTGNTEDKYQSVRQCISRLNRAFKDLQHSLLKTVEGVIELNVLHIDADVVAFDSLAARGDSADRRKAVDIYRKGLLLDGWPETDWLRKARKKRQQQYLQMLNLLAVEAHGGGRSEEAEEFLQWAIDEDLRDEQKRCQLMRLLIGRGQYLVAMVVYYDLKNLLEDAGEEPGVEITALFKEAEGRAYNTAPKPPAEEKADLPATTSRKALKELLEELLQDRLQQLSAGAVRQRGAEVQLELAKKAKEDLRGAKSVEALKALDAEYDHYRAALSFSTSADGQAAVGMKLVEKLWQFWNVRGEWPEARHWMGAVLAKPENRRPTIERADVLNGLGVLATQERDYAFAFHALKESLRISISLGETQQEACTRNSLGYLADRLQHPVLARRYYLQSLALFRQIHERCDIVWPLLGLAGLEKQEQKWAEAREYLGQISRSCEQSQNQRGFGYFYLSRGQVAQHDGDNTQAFHDYAESLKLWRDLGDKGSIAILLEMFFYLAVAQESWDRAARLHGAAEAWRDHIHIPMWDDEKPRYDETVARVKTELGEDEYQGAYRQYQTMPDALASAIEFALSDTPN